MQTLLKQTAKKVPGLPFLVAEARKSTRWVRMLKLMRSLHPITTDKKLVRFGPAGDGGYLIPDDLDGIEACFSPGVSLISGFEKDCADRGMKVFLADGSVEGPGEAHELFNFKKLFIGGESRENFITLSDWVEHSLKDANSDLMLQMDIEGWEYEVLNHTPIELIERFRIIVIEFHELDWPTQDRMKVFRKLLKSHSCLHIHPNNCFGSIQLRGLTIPKLMEFTFLRNDRIKQREFCEDFPHVLDSDNTPNPPLILPPCWYRQKKRSARKA